MECESCAGSGSTEYELEADLDADGVITGPLTSAITSALSAFSVQTSCGTCGGTGEREETRELLLDELTSTQMSFLYQANLERTKAENGGGEEEKEQVGQQGPSPAPQNPIQNQPQTSTPSPGGPPVQGNVRDI